MRKFLISGVTSGLGKAFANYVLSQGDEVIPIVRSSQKHTYQQTHRTIISLDFDQPTQVITAFEQLNENIDVFVNFAGILPGKSVFETSADDLTQLFAINVITPLLICQAIQDRLNQDGVIVLLGSISGEKGSYDDGYAASKGAIHSLVKSLSLKFAPHRRVIGIAPGMFDHTRMTNDLIPGRYEETIKTRIPLHKAGQPNDLAQLIYFLTTPVCQYMTGALIDINGGQYLR